LHGHACGFKEPNLPDASSSKTSSRTGRALAGYSPAAAAAFVRSRREASGEGSTPPGKRVSQREALSDWADRRAIRFDSFSVKALEPIRPGAEHSVYYDRSAERVVKLTHPGSFGWSPVAEGLRATPLEYLDRLEWQNHLFSDEIAIIAVVGDKKVLQVVTSQPYIFEPDEAPDITLDEIDQFFESRCFHKVTLNPDAPWFFNSEMGIAVGDGHPGNFIRNVDGEIVPIDLVIGCPGAALLARIKGAI
jgi:hypothetical protein